MQVKKRKGHIQKTKKKKKEKEKKQQPTRTRETNSNNNHPNVKKREMTRKTALLCFASAIALLGTPVRAGSAKYPLAYCEAPLPELVPIDTNSYTLAQVSLVTRHGDRTPLTLMGDESDVTWDKCTYKEFQVPEVDPSVSYQKVVIPNYEYAPKVNTET